MADVEVAKRNAAELAVRDHFHTGYTLIGIGSGTTIIYVIRAIRSILSSSGPSGLNTLKFVPTGYQSRQAILKEGLTPISFDELPPDTLLDVAFDGADEVDQSLNCIKGGGACLFQEKLVALRARKFICVADHRKMQSRLLTSWPSVPIEVIPIAANVVLRELRKLGSVEPKVRAGSVNKAGPLKTDQDNFIIDAPFKTLLLPEDLNKQGEGQQAGEQRTVGHGSAWEVADLARTIRDIEGVLSVGIFHGEDGQQAAARGQTIGGQKPVAAYFGMADGGVVLRRAGESDVDISESKS